MKKRYKSDNTVSYSKQLMESWELDLTRLSMGNNLGVGRADFGTDAEAMRDLITNEKVTD